MGVVLGGLGLGGGEPLREAGAGGGGGLGAEDGDVLRGAADDGADAGDGGDEAEVAAEFGDEVAGGAVVEVVDEFGGVDALEEFDAERGDVVGRGDATDGVLDAADDVPPGDGAPCLALGLLGRLRRGWFRRCGARG